jgi:arylsulfatase
MIEHRYEVPFKFTGQINKVSFNLGPEQLTAEDHKQIPAMAEALVRARD